RIRRRPQVVFGDVRDDRRLTSRIRGEARRATQVSGCSHRMATRRAGNRHPDLSACPGTGMFYGQTRTSIIRPLSLEQPENMLRARSSPKRKQVVIVISEASA